QTAYETAREIDDGERVVVGLNRFRTDDHEPYEPLQVDPAIEEAQAERLDRLRASRDSDAVRRALDGLRQAAEGRDNVLVPMREALRARATGGEVADSLREVWGQHVPRETL